MTAALITEAVKLRRREFSDRTVKDLLGRINEPLAWFPRRRA